LEKISQFVNILKKIRHLVKKSQFVFENDTRLLLIVEHSSQLGRKVVHHGLDSTQNKDINANKILQVLLKPLSTVLK